jgi:hypothetical protein
MPPGLVLGSPIFVKKLGETSTIFSANRTLTVFEWYDKPSLSPWQPCLKWVVRLGEAATCSWHCPQGASFTLSFRFLLQQAISCSFPVWTLVWTLNNVWNGRLPYCSVVTIAAPFQVAYFDIRYPGGPVWAGTALSSLVSFEAWLIMAGRG